MLFVGVVSGGMLGKVWVVDGVGENGVLSGWEFMRIWKVRVKICLILMFCCLFLFVCLLIIMYFFFRLNNLVVVLWWKLKIELVKVEVVVL